MCPGVIIVSSVQHHSRLIQETKDVVVAVSWTARVVILTAWSGKCC